MGKYDGVANIKAIKKKSGAEKVFYLGYSQGTIQHIYGLARYGKEFYDGSVYKSVLIAPCTLFPESEPESYWESTLFRFPKGKVYNMYGPNWEANYKKICEGIGKDACDLVYCEGCEPVSVFAESHWVQNSIL